MSRKQVTIDGTDASAHIAFKTSEVIAIYPITPSSAMGEKVDEWATQKKENVWGLVPRVQEMQSEGGAAGAVHGALQSGALTTTFTSSQGLLLMIPNMYKIAGELTSAVFHIAARTVATHALSIFGDHSDVMAVRQTGFALLSSNSVQEVMDLGLIAHAATLEARIPFAHFFDGFRTSHELSKVEQLTDDDIRAMIDDDLVMAHRTRGLSPDDPFMRGSSQNPDVFFQAREAINPYYEACPEIVQKHMDKFAQLTGRQYRLFDYYGAQDATKVIIIMGSGAETCQKTVDTLNASGEKVGVLKVRLFRPFKIQAIIDALPKSLESIAVLDRTKEPGASGEPLYLDVINALFETSSQKKFKQTPMVICGRYGLSSKEFTPAMVKSIYDELSKDNPKNHFTVGIKDDVSHTSLDYDENFIIENDDDVCAIFYGLGSDGTVGANKNSIKIIGEHTDNYAQGYFVYDSKKAGSVTISHLRFGPKPIVAPYLVSRSSFVACHSFAFLEKYPVLEKIKEGGTFLINSPYKQENTWKSLTKELQQEIIDKKVKLYAIDANKVAREAGMGRRINTIMQTCFFAISGVLPKDEAVQAIKDSIQRAYGKKGEKVVQMNFDAVDHTLSNLYEIDIPESATSTISKPPAVSDKAPQYVRDVISKMLMQKGDTIPVSAMPADGTFPLGTAAWEKRNIAQEIPVWENDLCIQCGKCIVICPHAVIRTKIYEPSLLNNAPQTFKSMPAKDVNQKGNNYTIQVAPEDCTGCTLCVDICPVKSKTDPDLKALNMRTQIPIKETEKENWDFFLALPETDRKTLKTNSIRGIQTMEPLFEFSGACSGCGETPYIKLMTQLYGDRMLVANATGCSSIYGGNLPTTPWTTNKDNRGPAWANSLFEDNAEFGLGFYLAVEQQVQMAHILLKRMESQIGSTLITELLESKQTDEAELYEQRLRVESLKDKIKSINTKDSQSLLRLADSLVKRTIWIVGGDGWAYDIGFGGLDHVISLGLNINILVLDTEVYSNTGGQASKATPRAAVAKFAAGGKPMRKKDLGAIAMTYGHVYVANVAMGAKDEHTLKAFLEAEKYAGPSLIIAYSSCIAQGLDLRHSLSGQKAAVDSGYWPLYRYNPDLALQGKNPFLLDSRKPKISFAEYAKTENRFNVLAKVNPKDADSLLKQAQTDIDERWNFLEKMAAK